MFGIAGGEKMKRSAAFVLASALALSGCKTTSQADPYAPLALSPGKGAVVFTIDRHGRSLVRPFAIHAVRYDPQTGKLLGDSDDQGRGFKALYATDPAIGRDSKHWAFELEPGTYAIASVDRVGVATQPVFSGGSLAVLLIATAIATVASHAVAAAEHESHDFVPGDLVGPQTPRFTVTAGRVTHIGDFTFGSETRPGERTVPGSTWGGPNAVGMDHSKTEEITEYRTVVHYSLDTTSVDGYLRTRKLDRHPVDHQRLEALAGRPFVLEDFPGESAENRTPVRTAASGGPEPLFPMMPYPAHSVPAPVPAAAAPPVAGRRAAAGGATLLPDALTRPAPPAGLDALMQRFLDGSISKAEYDRARADLAKGS